MQENRFAICKSIRDVSGAPSARCKTSLHIAVIGSLLLGMIMAWPVLGQETAHAKLVEKLRSAIEYEVKSKDLPAFSIALVHRDRNVWSAGFGFEDAEKKKPASAQTVYRVGSVSKLFTDAAVMQQVVDGKMNLDAPVTQWLPTFKLPSSEASKITLRQLMSHRSGLVREPPIGHYFDPDEPTLKATVESLNETRLVYEPGTKTKYSNAAIAVVGAALESVTGKPFDETIRERLFQPIGMDHSSFKLDEATKSHAATGWMWSYDGRRFAAPEFALGTAPAGSMFSSVEDLANFIRYVIKVTDRPRSESASAHPIAQMLEPVLDADGKPQAFGLGFHIQELDGMRKIGHGGAVYGFATQVEIVPEKQVGVAAVAALDGANGVVGRLADYALRLMIAADEGKSLPDYERTMAPSKERLAQWRGDYVGPMGKATVQVLGNRAFLHRGVFRNELRTRERDGHVVIDDVFSYGNEVEFDAAHTLRIGKAEYRKRSDDTAPPDANEEWKELIGEYGWDHNTLFILEDHGNLVALIEWFYSYPLKQVGPDEFAFPDTGLYHGEKIVFDRDVSGRVVKAIAAGVKFNRREVGTKNGETFRIEPVRPIDELRRDALQAEPPKESGEFMKSDLAELVKLDPTIRLDVRYASTNNFAGAVFYDQPRAFLQRPAAEAVVRIHQRLKPRGLGLLVHDAYRPWYVTKMFWEATPASMKDFVANPANGSRHNRGAAVDLTLCDLATGKPIEMPAGYDEFSHRSFPLYPGGTERSRWYRDQLRAVMEADGFDVYEFEWWHFDFRDWKKYPIGNVTFEKL